MNKRGKSRSKTIIRFPDDAPETELKIDRIGGKGDGISQKDNKSFFIPGTLPGEKVIIRPLLRTSEGIFGQLNEVILSSNDRVEAPCAYFGSCGGCALQHWNDNSYQKWKYSRVVNSIENIRSKDTFVENLIPAKLGTRRRAELSIKQLKSKSIIGFHERESNRIIDIEVCSVLHPSFFKFASSFRNISRHLLHPGESARASINLLDTGMDVLLFLPNEPTLEGLEAINEIANIHNLCRVSVRLHSSNNPDQTIPILNRTPATITFSGVEVTPPPGTFLQATKQGSDSITEAVLSGVVGATKIIELFSGCGTLSIPLHNQGEVHAVEGDLLAATALRKAANKASISGRLSVENRDLSKRPILGEQLSKYDALVFDPPRSGAKKQAEQIAIGGPAKVVAVSCNPNTFSRDASILINGGYKIKKVTPIDQFLWSPHVELVAHFERGDG